MRWDNLLTEADEQARLPGHRDPATIRRFDAPEALDMRFYEIHAKSAINRVPNASQMPFRWTINPYRGCSHACLYCAAGETPVLMADGRHRPLAELLVGDEIYGTRREGHYRRYVRTRVLAHWSSVKPAYRVVLADGTELVASGDHRFLTERGWKHVTGAHRPDQRPHLTTANALLGTGRFADGPVRSDEYARGYLSGIVRGDGHLGSSSYAPPERATPSVAPRFRLALADGEAFDRASAFLLEHGVHAAEFALHAGEAGLRPVRAIRTQARSQCERVGQLIRWPVNPTDEWQKGFLAGIFDAEGSGNGVIRISSGNEKILRWIQHCLHRFGFRFVLEDRGLSNDVWVVRLRGGLRERLRFFHVVDPAIRRRLDIDGLALKSRADTRVVSVEPLGGAERLYDITTGTGDFIANGVVSHNCFARPTHKYLDFDAGRDFEREIVVKVNAPEVVRAELKRPSWKGEHVAMVFCPRWDRRCCRSMTRMGLAECTLSALVPSAALAGISVWGSPDSESSFREMVRIGLSWMRVSSGRSPMTPSSCISGSKGGELRAPRVSTARRSRSGRTGSMSAGSATTSCCGLRSSGCSNSTSGRRRYSAGVAARTRFAARLASGTCSRRSAVSSDSLLRDGLLSVGSTTCSTTWSRPEVRRWRGWRIRRR